MDDRLILTKTQKQYHQARKTISRVLGALKLKLSKRKSTWGALTNKTFHYLGLSYRIHRKPKKNQAKVQLHKRSHLRALDKALALTNHALYPDNLQRCLNRWASWWHLSNKLNQQDNLKTFW